MTREIRRIWICDVCGRQDVWRLGWQWYGPLLAQCGEVPPDVVVCSDECRQRWQGRQR